MVKMFDKLIGDKKRYRQFLKDMAALPAPYAATLDALQKYMWNFANGGGFMDALEEILRMFQESASEQVPVSHVIGDDPVAFADNIMAQYPDDLWLVKYQNKLRKTIKEIDD